MIRFEQFIAIVSNYIALYPHEVEVLKSRFELLESVDQPEELAVLVNNIFTYPDKLDENDYSSLLEDFRDIISREKKD